MRTLLGRAAVAVIQPQGLVEVSVGRSHCAAPSRIERSVLRLSAVDEVERTFRALGAQSAT